MVHDREDLKMNNTDSPSTSHQTTGTDTRSTIHSTTAVLPKKQKSTYGFHPSLVAGLTLLFIVIIIVLIIIVKVCLNRRAKLKRGSKTEKKRISSYKMYSEVDHSVFLAERVSEANNLRGPEDDSIEEYLKQRNIDSFEGIELQDMDNGNRNGEFKDDYEFTTVFEESDKLTRKENANKNTSGDSFSALETNTNNSNTQNLSNNLI